MNVKNQLVCLLIIAILTLCVQNVAVASTGKYSTDNTRHKGDHVSMASYSTSNGLLNWHYTTGGAVYSKPAVSNGIVYVGSADNNVYALDANTGAMMWKYTTMALR